MATQTSDPAVQELQRQVAELSNSVNSTSQLDQNLDVKSKDIIRQIVSNSLFDILWDTTYQYFTEFESLDGFNTTTGVGLLGGGAYIVTSGSGTNFQLINKYTSPSFVFDSTKRSNFRAVISVDQITAQNGKIQTGSSADEGYGFTFVNAALSIATIHGGITYSTPTSFVLNGTDVFLLEARYYPSQKVDFFVDKVLVGTLTSNLPSISAFSGSIWSAGITESEASSKILHICSVEYLQSRT
jgi:hypothetical protein